jgi:SAM-dependent methyltransferase
MTPSPSTPLDSPYASATGSSRERIEGAFAAAGLAPGTLTSADLAMLEDFHTLGRIATERLANLAGLTPDSEVLDAGSGIGGTARYIVERHHCRVTAVDLTEDYCATARWLNGLIGLGDRIAVHQGDVTDLPFADGAFDVVFSQHVQMNVADKSRLYRQARRVLADGGTLAVWDIAAGAGPGEPAFPLPWAADPRASHLVGSGELRDVIETSGFVIEHWDDLTDEAASLMRVILDMPRNPVGLHAFVPDFAEKAENLTAGLADGRFRAIQIIARAAGQ